MQPQCKYSFFPKITYFILPQMLRKKIKRIDNKYSKSKVWWCGVFACALATWLPLVHLEVVLTNQFRIDKHLLSCCKFCIYILCIHKLKIYNMKNGEKLVGIVFRRKGMSPRLSSCFWMGLYKKENMIRASKFTFL